MMHRMTLPADTAGNMDRRTLVREAWRDVNGVVPLGTGYTQPYLQRSQQLILTSSAICQALQLRRATTFSVFSCAQVFTRCVACFSSTVKVHQPSAVKTPVAYRVLPDPSAKRQQPGG